MRGCRLGTPFGITKQLLERRESMCWSIARGLKPVNLGVSDFDNAVSGMEGRLINSFL
jgi:hypothetical protein